MKRSRSPGAVRQKPTRTQRRTKLATALKDTGLDRKGVALEAPIVVAAPRQWKDRATAKAAVRATEPSRPRTNQRTSTGQLRTPGRAQQAPAGPKTASDGRPLRSGDDRPMTREARPAERDPRAQVRRAPARREDRVPAQREDRAPARPADRAPARRDDRAPMRRDDRDDRAPARREDRAPARREDRAPARPADRAPARWDDRAPMRRDDRNDRAPARRDDRNDRAPARSSARADERPTRTWAARPGVNRAPIGGRDRRALSMPRAPGRIDAGGDPRLAAMLAQALRDAGEDQVVADSVTHPVHTYPARMHPATARRLVELVMADAGEGLLVDPFCGSGTTLVEAREAGVRAFGSDLNPLAVRIARAKTWTAPTPRRRELLALGRRISALALNAVREARRATGEEQPWRGPPGFDPNARNRRLARWFAPHVRRELETIAARIDEVRAADPELAAPLEVALSAVLYKVSSRASDTDPSWVERNVPRGAAARHFVQRVELLCAGLDDLASAPGPIPEVVEDDARALAKRVGPGGAAGVVTSPPYAGTYDYAEQHRLRFDFLGIHHRALDEGEIGARRAWDVAANQGAADRGWKDALAQVTAMLTVILRSGGRAALVIGDSIAGGRAMRADDDLRAVLGPDLSVAAWAWQDRPVLGAAERAAFGERGKREHVLLLVRK